MIIGKHRFTLSIITLASISLFVPPAVFAQHGPGQHAPDSVQRQQGPGPHMGHDTVAYDTKTETILKGTVEDVKTIGPMEDAKAADHKMGPMGVEDRALVLKTDTGSVAVRLGPATFLTEKDVKIAKGDTVEVIGSRVTVGESQAVLAREIRKGNASWTLREANGQPLWATQHGPR